eukprot:TRINITY_DN29401_c0_g1_i1.p2 TRINITY_DN29401_c0_g1~~TRINITY_DN29401_c0_g1_i1.p2  ORF type:complete len:234 (+),score=21.37 TRINITY_DN29401_c0_g1_i1:475-1176(+)
MATNVERAIQFHKEQERLQSATPREAPLPSVTAAERYALVEELKRTRLPKRFTDLTPQLLSDCRGNPSLLVDEKKKIVTFRPKYDIYDRESLLRHLRMTPTGIRKSEVAECYHGIDQDITSMTQSGQVLSVAGDKKEEVLFLMPVMSRAVSEDVRSLWQYVSEQLPGPEEVASRLLSAGLSTETFDARRRDSAAAAALDGQHKAKRARSTLLSTNAHMEAHLEAHLEAQQGGL